MTTHPQTILIAGHYGFGNAGDEAILSAIISDLRALRPALKFIVVSGAPPQTEAAHGVAAVLWTDIEKMIQAVAASDLVILGGGGLFHDYWGFDPDSLLTQHHAGIAFFGGIPLLATLLNKPLMLYAVGVGPLLSDVGKLHTRAVFEQAAIATVRDAESKRLLEESGVAPDRVRVTADPAFRFQQRVIASPEGAKQSGGAREIASTQTARLAMTLHKSLLVGVALREWDIGVLPEYWERPVANALDIFVERRGGAVVFIPFQESRGYLQNDAAVAERVRSGMRNRDRIMALPDDGSVQAKAAVLGQCDLVLGMRLHSLIFAISSSVPAVGLVYDPKVRSVMAAAGIEDYAIDLGAVTAGRLAGLMEKALAERGQLSARLKESASALSELARENARLAVSLLEKAEALPPAASTVEVLKELALTQVRRNVEREAQAQTLQAQMREIEQAAAELRSQLQAQTSAHDEAVAGLRAEIAGRDRAIAELESQADERERIVSEMQAQADEREQAMGELQEQAREREQAMLRLQNQAVEQDRAIADAQARVADRDRALYKIHTSKHWKLMSFYWRAYDHVSDGYTAFRELLRRLLPVSTRRSFVQAYRRIRPPRPAAPSMQIEAHAALDVSSPARYDLLCFPVIDWEFRFQRPQQLAMQFARDGHRCFYLRTTLHQNGPAALLQNIAGRVVGVQLPGGADLNIYASAITPAMLETFVSALDDVRKTAGIVEAVCIVDLPFWTPLALAARERWGWKVVYDCMDEHGGFSTNSPIMLEQEQTLIKESDLAAATSRTLYLKIAPHARRALLLPNGVDFDHFNRPRADDPLAHLNRPIIGFYGAISDWFDVDMVRAAAERCPDWQFVLIGDAFGADVSPFKPLHNVHLLGEKSYAELPAYLRQFDVACIPFLHTKLTRATNPAKFYEYLSAGKPVVSVELPELESLREFFYAVRAADEFVPQIEAALRENEPGRVAARIEFARANTWPHRYQTLKESIRQLHGKAAVIVVSYNNAEYLRLCLESIFSKTSYPNYQVIVVDNGSDGSVVEYLQTSAQYESRLRVIFNGINRGFARANNIGIQAAGDAEYVVLLNDDTVLTRGWLTRLIRHLDDRAVGLIGPMTNCAANEAQTATDYRTLEDMERFAARYAREHDGQTSDIPMLAMYCAAMRKSLIDQIGLLDERFEIGMFEDDDFSLRARRAGFRVVCAEDVFVHHWGRASFSRMDPTEYNRLFAENRRKFETKWGVQWQPHRYRSQS